MTRHDIAQSDLDTLPTCPVILSGLSTCSAAIDYAKKGKRLWTWFF